MRLVLDSHENIAIAPETGVMRVVRANKFVPFWMFGGEWYQRLGIREDELDRELGAFYGGFLRRYADAQGKPRWGEKTPWHIWHVDQMARLWPGAVFVATVRHPGGNVGSMVSKWHFRLERAIAHWKNVNREVVRQSEYLGERLLLCRYEDLVLAPEPTLRELLANLGEPWSPSVLRHDIVHHQRGTAVRVEGRTRSTDPIDAKRATSWTEFLQGHDLERLIERTEAMGRFFGYSFDDAGALEPLVPQRRVVSGSELAERREQFADVPELREPPVVPAIDRPLDPSHLALRSRNRREKSRTGKSSKRRRLARRAARAANGARLLARVRRRVRRLAHGRTS